MPSTVVLLALVVTTAVISTAHAQLTVSYTVEIESLELVVGQEGAVDLRMTDVDDRPAGAWQIDVGFDPAIVSLETCAPVHENTVCNLERAEEPWLREKLGAPYERYVARVPRYLPFFGMRRG